MKVKVFIVWFMFLFALGFANFGLPYAISFFSRAEDCFTTNPNATFGYGPTGRPCPKPLYVSSVPTKSQVKGILPTTENFQNTSLLNSVLYLSTMPLYIFALVSIFGTIFLTIFFKIHKKFNPF